jgi:hypothetical protein
VGMRECNLKVLTRLVHWDIRNTSEKKRRSLSLFFFQCRVWNIWGPSSNLQASERRWEFRGGWRSMAAGRQYGHCDIM